MSHLMRAGPRGTALLSIAAIGSYALCATPGVAQSANACGLAQVIPLASGEPPAKIVVDPPLAEPLASRGVAIIQYCARYLHIAPVFGRNALAVSPRVGHVHVTVDDASWHWADASGVPIILRGLPPGRHTVCLELADANHQILDTGIVTFAVTEKLAK